MKQDKYTINTYWKYSKKLENIELINHYEKLYSLRFPIFFKDIIYFSNGGRPTKNIIRTLELNEHIFLSWLDLNYWKLENFNYIVSEINNYYKEFFLFPFGIDPFGNYFCIKFINEEFTIVFFNHENKKIEFISDSLESFLSKLYN